MSVVRASSVESAASVVSVSSAENVESAAGLRAVTETEIADHDAADETESHQSRVSLGR